MVRVSSDGGRSFRDSLSQRSATANGSRGMIECWCPDAYHYMTAGITGECICMTHVSRMWRTPSRCKRSVVIPAVRSRRRLRPSSEAAGRKNAISSSHATCSMWRGTCIQIYQTLRLKTGVRTSLLPAVPWNTSSEREPGCWMGGQR